MTNDKTETENKYILTTEEALSFMKKRSGSVHCQIQSGMTFIGADWDEEGVKEELENADKVEIGGPNCIKMGHGIVVFPVNAKYQSDLRFFEHNDKLNDRIAELENQA